MLLFLFFGYHMNNRNASPDAQNETLGSPKFWIVDYGRSASEKWKRAFFPSYVRSDWEPYYFWQFPLVISKIEGNIATIIRADRLLFWEIIYIDIIWENNEPRTLKDNKGHPFLCKIESDPEDKERKIKIMNHQFEIVSPLMDRKLETVSQQESHGAGYPLDSMELTRKYYILEKNKTFFRTFCLDTCETEIRYKKGWFYLPIRIEGQTLDNLIPEGRMIELPVDGRMCIIWGILAYWDNKKEEFRRVEIKWIDFRWIRNVTRDLRQMPIFEIERWDTIWRFSPSIKNPKMPETLEINWMTMLVERTDSENKSYVRIGGRRRVSIDVSKPMEVSWRTFYRMKSEGKNSFTDWKEIHIFKLDRRWQIARMEYNGGQYPIIDTFKENPRNPLFSDAKNGAWTKIFYFGDWEPRGIILLETKKSVKAKKEQIELKFSKEQAALNLVKVIADHWIVCLAHDITNTSRYQFYRINPDGTLTFVFSDNYNIKFWASTVELKGNWMQKEWVKVELVRRPWTTSIFEPIQLNGGEYLIAKWKKPWELVYVSIEENWYIHIQDIEMDPKSYLPKNTLRINNEVLHFNSDWKIKILSQEYTLSDSQGKDVVKVERAIVHLWRFNLLILKKWGNLDDEELYAYVLWADSKNKELSEVSHMVQLSPHSFSGRYWLKIISLDWLDTICRYDYDSMNALGIYETYENWYSALRYISKKKWEKLEWEEFICSWKKVIITEIISEEYVSGDGVVYYRPKLWKNLTKLNLPAWLEFFKWPYFSLEELAPFGLMMREWKLVPLSNKHKDYYRLEDWESECRLNWKNLKLLNVWDKANGRVISLVKKWSSYEPLMVWSSYVLNAEYGVFVIYSPARKPKTMYFYDNGIKVARTNDWQAESLLIMNKEDEQKDARWRSVFDLENWNIFAWIIYKVGQELVAVNPINEWYRITTSKSGEILINWIEVSKELLDWIYDKFKPDWAIMKVVSRVSKKVGNLS